MGYYNNRPKTNVERIRDAVEDINENGLGLASEGTVEGTATTLDKTWQEIYDSFSSGVGVVILVDGTGELPDAAAVVSVYIDNGAYAMKDANGHVYSAESADGYPVYDSADS